MEFVRTATRRSWPAAQSATSRLPWTPCGSRMVVQPANEKLLRDLGRSPALTFAQRDCWVIRKFATTVSAPQDNRRGADSRLLDRPFWVGPSRRASTIDTSHRKAHHNAPPSSQKSIVDAGTGGVRLGRRLRNCPTRIECRKVGPQPRRSIVFDRWQTTSAFVARRGVTAIHSADADRGGSFG